MSKPMVAVFAFVVIILYHLTLAQDETPADDETPATDETPVENEVASAFKTSEIVPDVIEKAPHEFLKVTFENDMKAEAGNEFTAAQVKEPPTIEWNAENENFYTLIMVSPDAPSRRSPIWREYLQWLVVNIPGNNTDQGDVLANYTDMGPFGSGIHRQVLLLYEQNEQLNLNSIKFKAITKKYDIRGRPRFKTAKFARNNDLGSPIAGNFIQAKWRI